MHTRSPAQHGVSEEDPDEAEAVHEEVDPHAVAVVLYANMIEGGRKGVVRSQV